MKSIKTLDTHKGGIRSLIAPTSGEIKQQKLDDDGAFQSFLPQLLTLIVNL